MYSILDGNFVQIQGKSVMGYMRQLSSIPWVTNFQLSTTTALSPSVALPKPSCMVAACDLRTPLPYHNTNPEGYVGSAHLGYLATRGLRFSLSRDKIPANKLSIVKSMEMSFFALPSQQGPVQGRFKPAHRPISLSTKVAACVRCFETPTAVNCGRTEAKKTSPCSAERFFHV